MRKDEKLDEAVRIVNAAIEAERKRLEDISNSADDEPVMIEGETVEGYIAHIMADPKDVARIYLKYDFHIWRILDQEAPDEMWRELGRFYGLENVCSADL